MSAKKVKERLIVFDLMRGFFIFGIIVNHLALYPNFLAIFTGATKLWVSMAEGFFIVSGFFTGYLYKEKIKNSFTLVWKKLSGKAIKLYLWTACLTLLFTYWGNLMPVGATKEGLWIVNWNNLFDLFYKTFSLRYTYGWADFLPYYSVFLLLSPLYLFFLKKGWWYVLLPINLILWHNRGENAYLAIQVLFYLGVIIGYYAENIKRIWIVIRSTSRHKIKTVVYGTFVLSLFASIFSAFFFEKIFKNVYLGNFLIAKNNVLNLYFDKQTLGLGRLLLSPVWFLTGMFLFYSFQEKIEKYLGWLFLLFGKNSLYAYIIHAFVIYPFPYFVLRLGINNIWGNSVVTIAAVIGVYLILKFTSNVFRNKF